MARPLDHRHDRPPRPAPAGGRRRRPHVGRRRAARDREPAARHRPDAGRHRRHVRGHAAARRRSRRVDRQGLAGASGRRGRERAGPGLRRQVHDVPRDGQRRGRRLARPDRRRSGAGRGPRTSPSIGAAPRDGARPDRGQPRAAPSRCRGGPRPDARHVAGARGAERLADRYGREAPDVWRFAHELDLAVPLGERHRPPPGRGRVGRPARARPRRSTTCSRAGCGSRRSCRTAGRRSRRASPRSSARSSAGTRSARPAEVERYLEGARREYGLPWARATEPPTDALILALDQGTTSSRAIAFGRDGRPVAAAQQAFEQQLPVARPRHPRPGGDLVDAAGGGAGGGRAVGGAERIAAIGITNQRETTIVWDRATGEPIADAIVWQSRITAPACERLRAAGHEAAVPRADGTAARRVLQRAEDRGDPRRRAGRSLPCRARRAGLRHRRSLPALAADRRHGRGGRRPRDRRLERQPDAAVRHPSPRLGRRAARARRRPAAAAPGGPPDVRRPRRDRAAASSAGRSRSRRSPATSRRRRSARRASSRGQAKNTYGTGAFLLLNTGTEVRPSAHGLLSTVGWQLAPGGPATYALEGSVFSAGSAVQWLRDGLGLIERSEDVEALAASVAGHRRRVPRPAFTGLGAPYWDPERARHDRRAHARERPSAARARDARVDRVPGRGRPRGDGRGRRTRACHAPRRRRRGGQRPAAPAPGGPARRPGRAPGRRRDDRPRRGVPRWAGGRVLGRPRRRSRRTGRSTAASSPRCPPTSAHRCATAGIARSSAPVPDRAWRSGSAVEPPRSCNEFWG